MVQSILAGNKTQTRRIITKHRSGPCGTSLKKNLDWNTIYPNNPFGIKVPRLAGDGFDHHETVHRVYSPYEVGDHLWVKETFRPIMKDIRDPGSYERIDTVVDYYEYKADKRPHIQELIKWKPSIFMPKEASRIILDVTDIQAERLWDITEEDAKAEGFKDITAFGMTWVMLNGGSSWEANTWVWKISFEIIIP